MRYDALIANQRILGQHFVNRLNDKTHPLLVVGKVPYTRHTFCQKFGVGNLLAAGRLQKVATELKINVMEFFKWSPREVAECGGLGTTCVYVLCAIGPFHGINIKQWYPDTVTFDTLKTRVRVEVEEKTATKTAKQKRHAALADAGTHVLRTRTARAQTKLAKSA